MHKTGHIGTGLTLYSPLALGLILVGFADLALLGIAAVVALAMLPDQDQRVPLIKHRGITHTVWFALLVGVAFATGGFLYGLPDGLLTALGLLGFGFILGSVIILSHIAADALTPMGVTPFAPLRETKYTYEVARASNPIANVLLLGLGIAATLLVLLLPAVF